MSAILGGILLLLGFTLMLPDLYWIWKCIRPERHWLRKLRSNNWKGIMWSVASFMMSFWLFKISLLVGLGRGMAYTLLGIGITVIFWSIFKFESVKAFLNDKPWKQMSQ